MTRSTADIVRLFHTRRNDCGPAHMRAQQLEAIYEGKVRVPLPELQKDESPSVTNWIRQGLDQMAMRVASVTPAIECPPVRPGFDNSEKNAKIRRRALLAWWQENGVVDVQLSKRARWLVGYASAPAIVRPDPRRGIPVWELRDPRSAYPAPNPDPAGICPDDCIFAVKRRLGWIQDKFPRAARALDFSSDPNPDREFECLEYIDADEHVLIALGHAQAATSAPAYGQPRGKAKGPEPAQFVELVRFPNQIGRCTAVIPQRISLNMPRGQFDDLIGLYHTQSRAMALWILATQRAIFPDLWFISKPGEQVSVLKLPDGPAGIPGEVAGGDLKEVVPTSAPQVMEMLQMVDQNLQRTGGISPAMAGEMPSNVRTGKAGTELLSATVDFFVQEAQRALGRAMQFENALAIDTSREYFGDQKKTYFILSGPNKGAVDYVPDRDFDSNANLVEWPHAGADINALSIGIGQRVGIGLMSLRTGRKLDPWIDDPDLEEERCTIEMLDKALEQAIAQQILTGQIGPLEVLQIRQQVISERKELDEAYQTVHQSIQAQAMAAQQSAGMGAMGGGAGPGAGPGGMAQGGGAPGLQAPGVAAQLGLPQGNYAAGGPVAPPSGGVQDVGQILSALRPRSVGR